MHRDGSSLVLLKNHKNKTRNPGKKLDTAGKTPRPSTKTARLNLRTAVPTHLLDGSLHGQGLRHPSPSASRAHPAATFTIHVTIIIIIIGIIIIFIIGIIIIIIINHYHHHSKSLLLPSSSFVRGRNRTHKTIRSLFFFRRSSLSSVSYFSLVPRLQPVLASKMTSCPYFGSKPITKYLNQGPVHDARITQIERTQPH